MPASNAQLTAVFDIDAQANEQVAKEFSAQPCDSIEAFLTHDIEAVYVASPAYLHHQQVLAAAKGGKHVLCEKPLGMTIKEAEEITVACKKQTVLLGTGIMMRFQTFVNQYNRQIVDRAHEKGLKVVRHSDGNLWPLMDILLETGYDGINPLEPQAGMDIKKMKEYCGDKICLLGNIDCIDLLPSGTPDQVEQAVIQTIKDGAKDGGLIICSSNSLHPGVNPENCIAMFEAVRKHGWYNKDLK